MINQKLTFGKVIEKISLYGGVAVLVWHLITYYSDQQTSKAVKEQSDKDYDSLVNKWMQKTDTRLNDIEYIAGAKTYDEYNNQKPHKPIIHKTDGK